MKRLHLFLLKSYIGPLFLTFLIALFILLMQFLWLNIDDMVGKGLEWNVILELIYYIAARLVPSALPLAILLSSIMTFGNLGENFELTAIKSAGISLQKFMLPLIIVTVLLTIGSFLYSNYIIPYSNLKAGTLLKSVQFKRPELQITEGVFYNGFEGFSIKVEERDPKTNLLKKIMIYDHRKNEGNVQVTVADSGFMNITTNEKYLVLTLFNGNIYEEIPETSNQKRLRKYPHKRQKFSEHKWIIELTGLDFNRVDDKLLKNNYKMMNLTQLESAIDSLSNQYNSKVCNFSKNLVNHSYYQKEESMNQISERVKLNETHIELSEYEKNNFRKIDSGKCSSMDVDSIYTNLSLNIKKQAITAALTYARNTQSSLSSNKLVFLGKLEHIHRHEIEWHKKFSLAFACLVFFFIGAPFGAIIRKGGFGTPVVLSIVLFILYYMLSITGEKLVKEGVVQSYIGMWFSSFVLIPLGLFLTYKAATDSQLLSKEAYKNYLRSAKKIFKKGLNRKTKFI